MDKIRLPTRLFLEQTYYDNAVVKVEAMEEFEDKQNMTISEVNKGGVLQNGILSTHKRVKGGGPLK